MHLGPASFDSKLIKGEILYYYKHLIILIKSNHILLDQSFHSALSRDEDLKHHSLQPGDFIYWKRDLQKRSPQPGWKGLFQALLTDTCATKLQGIDRLWIHITYLKKAPNPDQTAHHLVT